MKDKEVTSKKFLYGEHKKNKEESERPQFHSKSYKPSGSSPLIDLDSVWSVKNIVLDSTAQPAQPSVLPDLCSHAGTSYYSRYGKYNNPNSASSSTVKLQTQSRVAGESSNQPSQWNKRSIDSLSHHQPQQQQLHCNPRSSDTSPLDF